MSFTLCEKILICIAVVVVVVAVIVVTYLHKWCHVIIGLATNLEQYRSSETIGLRTKDTLQLNEPNILSSTIYLKTNKNIKCYKNTNTTQSVCEPFSEPMMQESFVKRPRMLSTQSVALYKMCKPKPRLSTHICLTRPQWVKTEKDNELPIPGRFSNQIGILDI